MKLVLPLINPGDSRPLYVQLYTFFIKEIRSGRMPYGTRLPSKRVLSRDLGISLNTVDSAYQQLLAEGYIESRPRKGMFVIYQDEHMNTVRVNDPVANEEEHQSREKIMIDFSHGQVDREHFPFQLIRKYCRQIFSPGGSIYFQNGPSQGSFPLRAEIARYLYQSRAVSCTPEQIIIGAGTQLLLSQLLSLVPNNLPFAMENPGFHRVRELVKQSNLELVDIPVEPDGLDVDSIQSMDQGIVYVTPSHQFPLGMILPVSKRMKLIQWADAEANRYIIEDDYDGEFRYIGKPIPSLQGLDQRKKVIYLGTFSKLFIPSLRISYMVLPPSLVAPYQRKFRLIKQTASTLNQQLIYRFMENGDWQHHLNRMRTLYKQKHQILVQELSRHFKGQGKIIGEKSGLHLIVELNNGMSEQELIESARANGIKVYPTSIYYAANRTPEHPQILLGYGGLTENDIREGIKGLARAWK